MASKIRLGGNLIAPSFFFFFCKPAALIANSRVNKASWKDKSWLVGFKEEMHLYTLAEKASFVSMESDSQRANSESPQDLSFRRPNLRGGADKPVSRPFVTLERQPRADFCS